MPHSAYLALQQLGPNGAYDALEPQEEVRIAFLTATNYFVLYLRSTMQQQVEAQALLHLKLARSRKAAENFGLPNALVEVID
jgi:hypothetical protein